MPTIGSAIGVPRPVGGHSRRSPRVFRGFTDTRRRGSVATRAFRDIRVGRCAERNLGAAGARDVFRPEETSRADRWDADVTDAGPPDLSAHADGARVACECRGLWLLMPEECAAVAEPVNSSDGPRSVGTMLLATKTSSLPSA